MKPTPAQIEAARTLLCDKYGVLVGYDPMSAAITAAAEVGETNQQMLERWDKEDGEYVRRTNNATIERCAQVAEMYRDVDLELAEAIAAAIRALRDKP